MGAPQSDVPPLSAIQAIINGHKVVGEPEAHFPNLALQIAHSLRFAHDWTDVRIHRPTTSAPDNVAPLPRPMISGLPPRRLYVHPDEQIELLRRQKAQGKTGLPELSREREWVLPCHLRERWTLRKFAEVFDAIDAVPPAQDGEVLFQSALHDREARLPTTAAVSSNKWRTDVPKRVLLATLDDDSTVVYYIVHDGIVKPRQN